MKKCFTFLLFLIIFQYANAQADYFQQEVNTRIEVTLNDSTHTLEGSIEMDYVNNSPDELTEIYIHLWANAYRNRNTAFAKQKNNQGSGEFYFAKPNELGRFKKLNFTVDNNTVEWAYHKKQIDIAVLKLLNPLKSGDRITIKTPLNLKIPSSFSRLGHVGESYQLTQWFPKPAVYDKDGWHPMSYVDMGEFYSEFGSYDVKITLPKNYIVGATGELQDESEKQFLMKRVNETSQILAETGEKEWRFKKDTFPLSSPNMKTLHYKAEKVHDFAWFADKRFYVQKSEVTLRSGKKIDTWVMFNNAEVELWRKGVFYVDRSVKFYSEHVGEYPYPQATAVQSALSAGGGMEYPMITVIGLMGNAQALDGVITHEVGHNWFYGILAFNERDNVWMDEGMNSYYDHRYTEQYYGADNTEFLPEFMMKGTDYGLLELAYLYQARRNLDQAPATHSEEYSRINYFLGGYEKPAVSFKILEKYLGTAAFDVIMKSFYEDWKFKHPGPKEFRAHVEARTDKDLDWFFDGLIDSNEKTDYAFKGLKSGDDLTLKIKNKADNPAPFPVMAIKNEEVVQTKWYDGFDGTKEVAFPGGDYDKLVIDEDHLTLDLYRKNNTIKTTGAFKTMAPIRLKFLAGVESSTKSTIYWTPLAAYNIYDKAMLGLGIYNATIPSKRFEFSLAPLYSFARNELNGLGNIKFNLFPKTTLLKRVTLDLGVKKFTQNYLPKDDNYLRYTRLVPKLTLELGSHQNKPFSHRIEGRALLIREEVGTRINVDSIIFNEVTMMDDTLTFNLFNGNAWESSQIYEIAYSGENRRAVNPFSYRLALEQRSYTTNSGSQNYLRASLTFNTSFTYAPDKNLDFRFFVGGFLQNSRKTSSSYNNVFTQGSYTLTHQGYDDYKYDELVFNRNGKIEGSVDSSGFFRSEEVFNIFAQQVNQEEGGMKVALGNSASFSQGQSNRFILALNFKADLPQTLPFNLPLKPYFDMGYYKLPDPFDPSAEGPTFKEQFWWSGGIMLDFENVFSVHFPLVNSNNLKDLYKQWGSGKYGARITFTLDLNRANPFDLINRIEF